MAEATKVSGQPSKRKKVLLRVLGVVALAAVVVVGGLYAMGVWPFAGADPEQAEQPAPPASSGPKTAAAPTTPAAAPTAPAAVSPSAGNKKLPPIDAQELMFWEQYWSEEQIADLVADKFAYFELSKVDSHGDKTDVRVKSYYREGGQLNGWMLLHRYYGVWYFSMITRDGNPKTTPVLGPADMAVATAMVEQQAANPAILTDLVRGIYKKMTIDKVTTGSGTATIDVTLSGDGKKGAPVETKAQITCISKDFRGTEHWFITAFSTL